MSTMFFDSHSHYDDERFDADRDEILSSMNENGVSNIINVASDIPSSYSSVKIAEKYDFIYASVGVHPHEVKDMGKSDLEEIRKLSCHEKVVAIGEIGLDYYYDHSPRDKQKYWFKKQMDLAYELKLPVIIHSRDAMEDTINICKECKIVGGIIHCFSGSAESAKIFLDLGYHISFAGPITFKNSKNLPKVAEIVPWDRILIETDCPYMAPEPHRGKRNSSLFVKHTAEAIAKIKGVDLDFVAKVTGDNAKRLFSI